MSNLGSGIAWFGFWLFLGLSNLGGDSAISGTIKVIREIKEEPTNDR